MDTRSTHPSDESSKKRIYGFDLGTASIGWAVLEEEDVPKTEGGQSIHIVDAGVRCFPEPVEPDTRQLKNPKRRSERLTRRRISRKALRKQELKALLARILFPGRPFSTQDFHDLFRSTQKGIEEQKKSPFQLRIEALNGEKLTREELFRALFHYAKHRGYRSSRSQDIDQNNDDAEQKKVLRSLQETRERKEKEKIQYTSQLWYEDQQRARREESTIVSMRNKSGDYAHVFLRSDIEDEIRAVLKAQRVYYPELTEKQEEKFIEISMRQRPLKAVYGMVGRCGLEREEKRAPKFSAYAEEFILLTKIQNLRIVLEDGERALTVEEKQAIKDAYYEKHRVQTKGMTYKHVRKVLDDVEGAPVAPPDQSIFTVLDTKYRKKILALEQKKNESSDEGASSKKNKSPEEAADDVESATSFMLIKKGTQTPAHMQKAIDAELEMIDPQYHVHIQNIIANAVSYFNEYDDMNTHAFVEDAIGEYVHRVHPEIGGSDSQNLILVLSRFFTEEVKKKVFNSLDWSGVTNYSLRAYAKLLPLLRKWIDLDKAVEGVGYTLRQEQQKSHRLPTLITLEKEFAVDVPTNPLVIRATSQFRRLFHAMLRTYGPPHQVNFELLRTYNTIESKKKVIERQKKNNAEKTRAAKLLEDNGTAVTGINITKARFLAEQDNICVYCERTLSLSGINDYEIDHIIPISLSQDDSLSNKVLVHRECNQNKRNRTPYHFLKDASGFSFDNLKTLLKKRIKKISSKKRLNLLNQQTTEEIQKGFTNRHFSDTSYISRFIKNYLEDFFDFPAYKDMRRRILVTQGSLTSMLRDVYKIQKIRGIEGYLSKKEWIEKRYAENLQKQTGLLDELEMHYVGDRHHAFDAICVGLVSYSFLQRYAGLHKRMNFWVQERIEKKDVRFGVTRKTTAEVMRKNLGEFGLPSYGYVGSRWNEISKTMFVSRSVEASISGALHKETVFRKRREQTKQGVDDWFYKRISLASSTKEAVRGYINTDKVVANNIVQEAVKRWFDAPDERDEKGKKVVTSFPKVRVGQSLISIRNLTIKTAFKLGTLARIDRGFVENESHIRADLFSVEEKQQKKYYLRFVSPLSFQQERGTMKEGSADQFSAGTRLGLGRRLDASYQYKFSLFPGEAFQFQKKKNGPIETVYFVGGTVSDNRVEYKPHDRRLLKKHHQLRMAVTSLHHLQKVAVDYLGGISCIRSAYPPWNK